MKKTVDEMTDYELARWCALWEGVNLVAHTAEKRGIDFEKVTINEPPMRKYINSSHGLLCNMIKAGREAEKSEKNSGYDDNCREKTIRQ